MKRRGGLRARTRSRVACTKCVSGCRLLPSGYPVTPSDPCGWKASSGEPFGHRLAWVGPEAGLATENLVGNPIRLGADVRPGIGRGHRRAVGGTVPRNRSSAGQIPQRAGAGGQALPGLGAEATEHRHEVGPAEAPVKPITTVLVSQQEVMPAILGFLPWVAAPAGNRCAGHRQGTSRIFPVLALEAISWCARAASSKP